MKNRSTKEEAVLNGITRAFSRLISEYGFSGPTHEQLGHEQYFRFFRGDETISIMFDWEGAPLIELFLPVGDGSPPAVPWAGLNGIARYRRFPKIIMNRRPVDQPEDSYFQELATEFERAEAEYLRQPSAL